MSSSMSRAKRLVDLYRLRAQVAEEIARLEASIAHEDDVVTLARESLIRTELCGTDSGYAHHRRVQKVEACRACKRAHSRYESARARRQKTREEAA